MKKEKVSLRIRSLESKVTPSCADEVARCNAVGGRTEYYSNGYGQCITGDDGGWFFDTADTGMGRLAAVADF